jgi:Tol biopolymer transport system component
MGDVKLFLEEVNQAAPVPAPRRSWRLALPAVGLALAVLGAAGFAVWRGRQSSRGEMRIVPLTSYPGNERAPSFSPDGTQVAFQWNGEDGRNHDIYVKVVGSTAAPLRVTSDPAPDLHPAWSPDGRQIAFLRIKDGSPQVYLVSSLGGDERKLINLPFTNLILALPLSMSWSPDGQWLALSERPAEGKWGISLLSVGRRERRTVNTNASGIDYQPEFSPDGRSLAYVSCPGRTGANCHVWLQELDRELQPHGPPRQLTHEKVHIRSLSWSPDGQSLLYSASGCMGGGGRTPLWRVAVSGGKAPERVPLPGPNVEGLAVSRTANRLAYVVATGGMDIWSYPSGMPPRRVIASTGVNSYPHFSPDGSRIVFASDRASDCMEVWVSQQDGTAAARLAGEAGSDQNSAQWSPDGRWIAFDSPGPDGHVDVYVVDAAGGPPRLLTPPSTDESVPAWSRDGKWVYFRSNRTGRNEIWKVPVEGGEARQMTFQGGYTAQESFDGATLLYIKEPGSGPLFAAPAGGGAERRIADWVLGRSFSPTGDGVYFIGPGDTMKGPPVLRKFEFKTERTQTVRQMEARSYFGLTVSPDGKDFLVGVVNPSTADLMLIENFR